jgi:hypothetical protein
MIWKWNVDLKTAYSFGYHTVELPGNPNISFGSCFHGQWSMKEMRSQLRSVKLWGEEKSYLIESNLLLNIRFKIIISSIKSNGIWRERAMNNPVLYTKEKRQNEDEQKNHRHFSISASMALLHFIFFCCYSKAYAP